MTSTSAIQKRMGRHLAILPLCAALLAGCQHMPVDMPSLPFVQNPAADAATLVADLPAPSDRAWPDARLDVLNQRARGYGLVRLPEMQAYLDGILARIKQQAGVPGWPGAVHILASPSLDAFATAAGNIYISQSWLASAASEDEIAALLSHEFAHVYLHYHQLETAVQTSDTVLNVANIGVALATKAANAHGWTDVDSLTMGYVLGRELVASAWGRSQESAADMLGLNLSLKLGYSFEAGFQTFLERMATWEEESADRQKAMEEEMLRKTRQSTADAVKAQNQHQDLEIANAVFQPLAEVSAAVTGGLQLGISGVGKLWAKSTSRHPDTIARLDRLAMALGEMPSEAVATDAVTAPWLKAQRQRRTAETLKNYQFAIQALQNLEAPDALSLARKGASGATRSHALPVNALYKAQLARSAAGSGRGKPGDVARVFDANMAQEPDRAWVSYIERSAQLLASGKTTAARNVLDEGFRYFRNAPHVWPEAIALIGSTHDWTQAKRLAEECKSRFPGMAEPCKTAAATPAEVAEERRKSEKKAKDVMDRLFK